MERFKERMDHATCYSLVFQQLELIMRGRQKFYLYLISLSLFVISYADESSAGQVADAEMESNSVVVPENMKNDLRLPQPGRHLPFEKGETLKYTLGWGVFTAADTILEVRNESADEGSDNSFSYTLKTKTKGFVNAIYPVDNVSFARSDADVSRSLIYKVDQDEGNKIRKREILFDWEDSTAQYVDLLAEEETTEPVLIMEGTFDPLSIVFYVRTLDYDVGDRIVIPTTNGKELFFTIVHVREKVTRKFKSGTREAYVLEPDIKDLGGVFKKSKDGRVTFFFSADEHRLPLRMESEVAVGSFWAELTHAEVGGVVLIPEESK